MLSKVLLNICNNKLVTVEVNITNSLIIMYNRHIIILLSLILFSYVFYFKNLSTKIRIKIQIHL